MKKSIALCLAAVAVLIVPISSTAGAADGAAVTLEGNPAAFAEAAAADWFSNDPDAQRSASGRLVAAGETAVPPLVAALSREPLDLRLERRALLAMGALGREAALPLAEYLAACDNPRVSGALCDVLAGIGGATAAGAVKMVYERSGGEGALALTSGSALSRLTKTDPAKLPPAANYFLEVANEYYTQGTVPALAVVPRTAMIWSVQKGRLAGRPVVAPRAFFFHRAAELASLAVACSPSDPAAARTLLAARAAEFEQVDRLHRAARAGAGRRGPEAAVNAEAIAEEYRRVKKEFHVSAAAGPAAIAAAMQQAAGSGAYGAAGELAALLESVSSDGGFDAESSHAVESLLGGNDKIARYRAAAFLASRSASPSQRVQETLSRAVREAAPVTVMIVDPNEESRRALAARLAGSHKIEAASVQAALDTLADVNSAVDLIFIAAKAGDAGAAELAGGLDKRGIVANAAVVVVLPTEQEAGSEARAPFLLIPHVLGVIGADATKDTVTELCADHLRGGDYLYREELEGLAGASIELLMRVCVGGLPDAGERREEVAEDVQLVWTGQTVPLLREALTFAPPAIRLAAVRGLGCIGAEWDADRFGQMLLDGSLPIEMRLAAGDSAGRIAERTGRISPSLIEALRRALAGSTGSPQAGDDERVRAAAAIALGRSPLDPRRRAEIWNAR